jgi:hypothetical protein
MDKIHKFEEAGLGKAPFRYVNTHQSKYQACPGAPIQPGTCCDYCGTGIMDVFVIADVNGKKFKVGCECVKKTGDAGLIDLVKRAVNQHKREARDKARTALQSKLKELLASPAVQQAFRGRKHPNEYFASKGVTYADYAQFLISHASDAGKKALLAEMEKIKP